MTIAWVYLDKRSAAINALKDYADMEYIIQHAPFDVADARAKMPGVKGTTISDMPKHTPDPHAGEERMAAAIDEIDILKERYRQALEYMDWFNPAWAQLKDDDKFVLREFYLCVGSAATDSVGRICEHFNIERTSAYKKKNRALDKLTTLLYGK